MTRHPPGDDDLEPPLYGEDPGPQDPDPEDATVQFSSSALSWDGDEPEDDAFPCLLVVAGPDTGRVFILDQQEAVIGRAQRADITLNDDGVSRRHVRFERSGGEITVVDLDSTNGLFVDGVRVKRANIQDGAQVRVGKSSILKFSYRDALEEQFLRRMYDSAVRDGLTGVHNKRYFDEAMVSTVAHHRRRGWSLSLIMLDIDHFKRVNDTWGHPVGDQVLKEVARLLDASRRADDVLARYGGEEFALVLRATPWAEAARVAERVRIAVAAHAFVVDEQVIPLSISLGVACLEPEMVDHEALIEVADACLYAAKAAGRDQTWGPQGPVRVDL